MADRRLSLELYEKLYMARRAEELIVKHYGEDEMKTPMHMSMGQEAIAVGVCHALQPADQIFGFYRSHATFLAKTGNVEGFFGELYGRVTGVARGKAGSMHLADPSRGHMVTSAVVASSIPVAVGTAFANKQLRNGQTACAFFGDGAVEEGVFWESLNVASVKGLPVLFVCEDNGLAIHTLPQVRWGFKRLGDVVRQFACSFFESGTTDVEEIYDLTRTAVEAIRTTGGPALMHLKYYRYLDHIGIHEDFDIGYRPRAEYETWLARDPLALQRRRLLEIGYSEDDVIRDEQRVDERVESALAQARVAPFPGPEELGHGVFHETD